MQFGRRGIYLFGGLFCLFCISVSAYGQEPVRIASNIEIAAKWVDLAPFEQRKFLTRLGTQSRPVSFEVIPYNRFHQLMENEQIDCVLSSQPAAFGNTIAAVSRVRFELRLFTLAGVDLTSMTNVEIGILANLPRPNVPLTAKIIWHDLSSLEQSVDLLSAGRLDAIVGDIAHIRMYDNISIVQADLPPVITIKLALICRDTEPLREFVGEFDSSMGVSGFRHSQSDENRYTVLNAW